MPRLNEMQEKARKLIEEGITILKHGVHDAGYLAEYTAGAARLHVDASRKRFELYRVLHDLGAELFSCLRENPAAESFSLTPTLAELIEEAGELDRSLQSDEEELGRFSVVKGRKGSSPKPIKKKPRQKAKPPSRPAVKRTKKAKGNRKRSS